MAEFDKLMKKFNDLTEKVREVSDRFNDVVDGNGLVVLHNTRIDVDASVRITDLLKKNRELEARIVYLESVVGSETNTETTNQVTEIKIGNFRFYAPYDGNTLYKQADLLKGSSINPGWETRGEDTI